MRIVPGCVLVVQVGIGEVVASDDAGQYPQPVDALALLFGCQPSLATHAIRLTSEVRRAARGGLAGAGNVCLATN